jgi:hypothetical protein
MVSAAFRCSLFTHRLSRAKEILKNLHFVDNSKPDEKDPLWKLRSIIAPLR